MTIRSNGALGRFACGVLLCALSTAALAQKPPDPPAPPWKDFIKTNGHDNEIPVQWVATPEGRFAHDIVLPPSIPKTVPFDFKAAKLRALKPGAKSVSKQYWEHLCNTEAGSFILKPVENVDGFFFMRAVHGANDQENNDRWKLEAPGMEASLGWKYNPEAEAISFVQPPATTYEWVDFPARDGVGVLRFHDYQPKKLRTLVDARETSDAQYGVVWRGMRRPDDRQHAIAGTEWIAIDLRDGTVLGVIRDFYRTGSVRNRPEGISWLNANRCPFKRALLGRIGEAYDLPVWAPMVLKPRTEPAILKALVDR